MAPSDPMISEQPSSLPCYSFWRSAAAAVQGRSHESRGTVCQDKVFSLSRHPLHVIALADGAGSCPLSHEGAELVTEETCSFFRKHIRSIIDTTPEQIRDLLHAWLIKTLASRAKALKVELKALSSTLLFVAVYKDEYIAGHIGDGTIAAVKGNESVALSLPESGEYKNETYFLTSQNAREHFRIEKAPLGGIDGFMLMSDGSDASLFDLRHNLFSSNVRLMISWLDGAACNEVQAALADNMNKIIRMKTVDDCSMAILRKSSLSAEALMKLSDELIVEMLKSEGRQTIFSVNHARILKALGNGIKTTKGLAAETGLSARTTGRHLAHAKARGYTRDYRSDTDGPTD